MFSLIDTGIVAADDLLAFMLDEPVRVEKAGATDILSLAGFDKFVLTLLDKFVRVADPIERKALGAMLRGLDQDWPGMTPAARSDAIRAAGEAYLGISAAQGPRIGAIIRDAGEEVHNLTTSAAKEQFDLHITPHLSAIDRRVIDSAAQANALFIRDQAGKRSELLSIRARNVAAQGLEAGYDGKTIAEMMGKELAGSAARQNKAYLRIVADAMTGRARSYAALRSLEEAEITHYEIVAVLDEVTSECCRFMDGKVFSVTHTLGKYQEAATASETEPEAVKRVQPWIRQGKDAEGRGILYLKNGAERSKIATINAPGMGVSDRKGDYAQHANDAALAHAGISAPPYHGGCRTTIVPSTETMTTSTSAQVPAGFGQGWEERAPVEVDEPAPLRPEEPERVVTEAESAAIEREVEPTWKPIKPKGGYLNLRAPDFKDQDGKKKKIRDPDLEARLANIFTTGSYAYEGVEPDALTVEFGPIQSKAVDKSRPYLVHLERMANTGDLTAHTRDYDLNYRGDQYHLTWPSDKFDKGRVASFMVGPAKDGKPITAIKYGGKIYIHSGADKLAAALIKRETAPDVNLVDIDAWRATTTTAGAKSFTAAETNNTIRLLNSLPAAPTGEGVDTSAFGFTAHVKPTYTGDLASALWRLGAADVEELADRHGAVTPLDLGRDLKHVVGPRTINRGAVARTIGADLPSPIVVKQGERAWIHSGAESLAAARLGSPSGAQVRVIDLDKLGPATAVDPGEWARRLAPDLDAVKNGTATPEQQRAVREGFRALIAAEGMITRDDLRGTSRFTRNPVMNVINSGTTSGSNVAASHGWSGDVLVGGAYARQAADTAARLAINPLALKNATPLEAKLDTFGFHSLIHEEIHGASSARPNSYVGVGAGMEEALTELLARRVTRKTFGIVAAPDEHATPFGLPRRISAIGHTYESNSNHGSYNWFIDGLFNQVGEHTGHDDIHDRIERAALKTRAWNGGKSDWQTGEEQVRAFVDALDVEQPEQREALYAALIGPSSPLRP